MIKHGKNYINAREKIEEEVVLSPVQGFEKVKELAFAKFDESIDSDVKLCIVGKLAKILGPKGLLPNKKLGNVTFDVGPIVTDLKKGRSFFGNDKTGLVHFAIGKKSFEGDKLSDNLTVFMKALMSARPNTAKGKYIQNVSISSTMGPGVKIDCEDLLKS